MLANTPEIEAIRNTLRSGQQAMADWSGGELAVSAVPGAGKSTGMAIAAAIAIAKNRLHRHHQLIVVTFTRSAVSNIRKKIRTNLEKLGLPHSSFVVNTLHGLALNIANSHRELAGFSMEDTQIISEAQKQRTIRQAAMQWIKDYPQQYAQLLEGKGFDGEDTERLRRQTVLRTDILPNLAKEAIATAKSSRLSPADLRAAQGGEILEVAAGLYEAYNRLLRQQAAIDYDDMILGALRVLENDIVRKFWQQRIFAVFEDEAQDSSPLQTELLKILSIHQVESLDTEDVTNSIVYNLMRVGDPNQAINSTFTNADPIFFNQFCDECDRHGRLTELKQAGRSTEKIIRAANFIHKWVNADFKRRKPQAELPFRIQDISLVGFNDPQPNANPAPLGAGVEITFPPDVVETVNCIKQRSQELWQADPKLSMAVLVRQHNQGKFVCDQLREWAKEQGITIYDVEQRDRRSRVPGDMLTMLQFMERPHSPDLLKSALQLLADRQIVKPQDLNALASLPEQFLYPTILEPELRKEAKEAQAKCTGLLKAKLELPLYNLIAFIALTLDYDQSELATADKLSDRLSQQLAGQYNLPNLIAALQEIVLSESFEAVEEENLEDCYMRSGQLTVISMHKAKGLDWDVVFMPFLHERIFPGKPFLPESHKFLGDFSLPEVARAQIRALVHGESVPEPEVAWTNSQILKQAEEYRLLYVGMTRAKRLLWLSASAMAPFNWNNLENITESPVCPAIKALHEKL